MPLSIPERGNAGAPCIANKTSIPILTRTDRHAWTSWKELMNDIRKHIFLRHILEWETQVLQRNWIRTLLVPESALTEIDVC